MSAAKTTQKLAKKRSLLVVNKHFEQIFNAIFAGAIVIQHPVSYHCFAHPLWRAEILGVESASGSLKLASHSPANPLTQEIT
jgi:hypothetical protein